MKTHITAYTQITCDRCEKILPRDSQHVALKIEHIPGGRMAPDDSEIDLCTMCFAEVDRVIMESPAQEAKRREISHPA